MKKYKHKLNMLEPGIKMIEAIGILVILSIIFYVLKLTILFLIALGFSSLIGFLLFLLLIIEHHQDEVLNRQYIKERNKSENK